MFSMRLPDDVMMVKKLIENYFKHRCRTVRRNRKIGYEAWEEFDYFVNGKAIMHFRDKDNRQELDIEHSVYYSNKEFIRSLLLLFPNMVIIICL